MSDAHHKNVLAVKQHAEETRRMFKVLETKINTVDTLIGKIAQLELQVQQLQIKLFSGGATS